MIELFHVARTSIICAKRGRDFLSLLSLTHSGEKLSPHSLYTLRRDVHAYIYICTLYVMHPFCEQYTWRWLFLKLAPYYSVYVCAGERQVLRAWACVCEKFLKPLAVWLEHLIFWAVCARQTQFTCEGRKNHTVQFTPRTREKEVAGKLFTPFAFPAPGIPLSKFWIYACVGQKAHIFGEKIQILEEQLWALLSKAHFWVCTIVNKSFKDFYAQCIIFLVWILYYYLK